VRKGGVVSVIGAYGPTYNAVKIGDAFNKGLTLRMNQASVRRNLPRCFEHIQDGHINPREMITHRFPLDEIGEAYHMFSSKLDGCIKPMLMPTNSLS
jgi:threonine dehydrogenase-like Zn-dependent dehydrogenase